MRPTLPKTLQKSAPRSAQPPRALQPNPVTRAARTRKRVPCPSRGLAAASSQAEVPRGSSLRIQTVFTALLALGLGATAYGLYEFYSSFTMWPKEVRDDLRAGVKAKHQNDLGISERFLKRAYDTAQNMPLDAFDPHPHLKLSGIAALLGEVQEANNKPEAAYDTYVSALTQLQAHWPTLAPEERLRAVALAHKLGGMADEYQLGTDEEEKWLTFAVTEVLRVAKNADRVKPKATPADADTEKIVLAELALPKWITTSDIGAPIEALGAFYAKTGKLEYAMPLYLQAISLLVPKADSGKSAPLENLCRGAFLMNNLSGLIMRGAPTPEKLHQAEAWARNALALIEKTKSASSDKQSEELQICEQALAVSLFNLGSIQEMRNDTKGATELYMKSWQQSKTIGMREGALEAIQAMRRLERKERVHNIPGSSTESTPSTPTDKDKKTT